MSKIVALCGSPRKYGNTAKLLEAFIQGAEAAGSQVVTFSVADTRVNGCLACDYCMRNDGACIQQDGMQEIYDALRHADTVVFATPVYYLGMSAQLKAIIDRFYPSSAKRPYPVRSAALLVTYGGKHEGDIGATVESYHALIRFLRWENQGVVTAGGVLAPDDIIGNPALSDAEMLGRKIAIWAKTNNNA